MAAQNSPPTAKIEIYTWRYCGFCLRAKMLLESKGVEFIEYPIDGDNGARAAMAERAGGASSLPQIFINAQHIGGCQELLMLEQRGVLDQLLSEPGS